MDELFGLTFDADSIKEWVTTEQVLQLYGMNSGSIHSYAYRHHIPTKREYGVTYYSKDHLDELRRTDLVSDDRYYTTAEVAEKYGDGYVHLTSRQGVEIPFIKLDQIEEVKNALAEGDVVPGVCGPRVRTVTACQGAAICQSGCIDTYALAKELDERYFGYELPHKFKFGITGCQNNCLKAEENDVGIKGGMQVAWVEDKCIQCGVCVKACRNEAITLEDGKISIDTGKCNYCGRCVKSCPVDAYDAQPGYIVSFGGTFGNHISKGETIIPFIESHEKLLKVCDAALKFFEQNGKAGERLKFTIDRTGKEAFEKAIKEAYENE